LSHLQRLVDWCRRPSRIKIHEGEPITLGPRPKSGIFIIITLALLLLFARLTRFEVASPLGYLFLFSVVTLIFWLFGFFSPAHVGVSEDRWRDRDVDIWKIAQDMLVCEKCGAGRDEITVAPWQGLFNPLMATCKRCGHEWIYTDPTV